MKTKIAGFFRRLHRFHRNEDGMETLSVVLIIALAAVVGVAIYQFGALAVQFACDCLDGFPGESEDDYM